MATAAALAFVQKLYVAYYQRPADYAGQQFWAEKFDKDGGASAIASAFATSAESVTLYGSQALAAQINAVYQASFGRTAETAGLQFYLNEISQGRMTTGTMAVAVLNGAQGADLTVLNAKLAVAAAYTTAASDAAGILKYTGTTAADTARTFLSAVVSLATQASSTSSIAANLNSIVAAGSSFTLTAGIDSFTGSAGGDSFSSTLAGGFGLLDNLDGGAGTDILTVSDTTAIATATSQMVKNIETVSLNSSAGVTADMSSWTGLTKANLSGVGTMSATAADSVVASITTSGGNAVTVIGTGGDLAVTTGNTAGATVNIGQTAVANKFTSVSVTGGQAVNITDRSGAAAVTGSTLKTVTVNGAALATTITGDGVTTLNLTNLMGADTLNGVTLNAVAGTRALVLNLSGVDTLGDGKATATAATNTIQDATATSLSINAITAKSFDVTAVAGAATSVAVKADVDLHMDALTTGVAAAVNLMGAGKIAIDTATLAAAAVVTSTNTGGVTLGSTAALAVGQQFVGTASSGNDVIVLGATTVANTTGDGNDIVTVGAFATGGSVNAGANAVGGADSLIMSGANAILNTTTPANAATYSGFETLVTNTGIAGGNIDLTKWVGVNSLVTQAAITGGVVVTLNTANTVALGANSAGTVGFTVGATGATDTMTLNMNGWNFGAATTFTGIETLNINTGTNVAPTPAFAVGSAVIGANVDPSAAEFTTLTMAPTPTNTGKVVVTGASDLNITTTITAGELDATGLTGTAKLVMTANGSTLATTIKGSINGDTIFGSTLADSITAGLGADTVNIGSGQDLINLTEATAAADNLIWATAFATGNANAANVTDFAWGAGIDTFDMQVNLVNGTTTATSALVAITPVTVASNGTATANDVIFTFAGAGDLLAAGTTIATAVANAVTALTSGTDFASANIAAADSLILQMNDGTNTFVFQYVADATPATTAAGDLVLLGMFNGTTAALVGDFI